MHKLKIGSKALYILGGEVRVVEVIAVEESITKGTTYDVAWGKHTATVPANLMKRAVNCYVVRRNPDDDTRVINPERLERLCRMSRRDATIEPPIAGVAS